MTSYHKSSKPVIVHDDRHLYPRQPSADSSYSRSSTGSSASHHSTMPNGNNSSSGQSAKDSSKTYRSPKSDGYIKTSISRDKVTVVNHNGRGWDQNDPHPEYRPTRPDDPR